MCQVTQAFLLHPPATQCIVVHDLEVCVCVHAVSQSLPLESASLRNLPFVCFYFDTFSAVIQIQIQLMFVGLNLVCTKHYV